MPTKIKITVKDIVLDAELLDTKCAQAIAAKLPLETRPNEWGDEFYFSIPVKHDLDETATTVVQVGTIGFWPPGNALALFFGKTPMSTGADPVPASEVNIVGKVLGDATLLRKVKRAGKIRVE